MTKSPFDDEQAGPGQQAGSGSSSTTGDPAGFTGWTTMGGLPFQGLTQSQTASVAAAAGIGFQMASHYAGFMLGAMQGFMDAAQKSAATGDSGHPAGQGASAGTEAPQGRPERKDGVVAADHAATTPASDVVAEAADATAAIVADAAATVASTSGRGSRPAKVARPRLVRMGDDLKRINGIGPKLEQVLKSLDVTRFSEIAAWGDSETARFDRELGVNGRIVRDGWIEQARVLART